jgi:hypothetical protein
MAEALDVSKRYYEQLKQKTNDQKQDEDKVYIGCASLFQYLKIEFQADAEHDWNASLEWICDQAKLETLSWDNEIDNNKTSKENNNVGDNNEGGNQTHSEEEDGGKRDNKSSSSDDNEQYKDDRDKANKEDIKTKFWETDSDDDNEENEQ